MLVAGRYADKAVNIGLTMFTRKYRADIIAQIDFAIKREGYEMSFETMVLTGNNAANPHGIPGANKIENNALLFDLGCMVNGYANDMTLDCRCQPADQFKRYLLSDSGSPTAALDFIKPGVTAHEVDRAAREVIEKLVMAR